jgi:hypothetical protein
VCVGLGVHEEVVFYSLRQKQVCALPHCGIQGCAAVTGPWKPGKGS